MPDEPPLELEDLETPDELLLELEDLEAPDELPLELDELRAPDEPVLELEVVLEPLLVEGRPPPVSPGEPEPHAMRPTEANTNPHPNRTNMLMPLFNEPDELETTSSNHLTGRYTQPARAHYQALLHRATADARCRSHANSFEGSLARPPNRLNILARGSRRHRAAGGSRAPSVERKRYSASNAKPCDYPRWAARGSA